MPPAATTSIPPATALRVRVVRVLAALRKNLAFQDYAALSLHTYLLVRLLVAPAGPLLDEARSTAVLLAGCITVSLVATRGELLRAGRLRALVYRLGLFIPMVGSYFELRGLLPALQPVLVDDALHAMDRALFGVTPSVWLSSFNRPPVVEWFSFFYYSYFSILTLVLVPSLFFGRGRHAAELFVGAAVVCSLGHAGYTVVPGLGPYAAIDFAEPLQGGFWWGLVESAVSSAGAMMDIFPSLHTAYPTFFALHFLGHRSRMPFKVLWPVMGFFAGNIVIATMFLRWHWGIDVVFGLLLAVSARVTAVAVAAREERRAADGRQPVWERLVGA